jgi:hypothetical protein
VGKIEGPRGLLANAAGVGVQVPEESITPWPPPSSYGHGVEIKL